MSYKEVKEAFHADNPGSSVHYINAVSVTALTAYALYASAARRATSPVLDFLTIVLPLLLGVTVASSFPVAFNIALAALGFLILPPTPKQPPKPVGQWLVESDSEDESPRPITPTKRPTVKLPSQLVAESAESSALSSPGVSPGLSPGVSSPLEHRRPSPGPAVINVAASPPASPKAPIYKPSKAAPPSGAASRSKSTRNAQLPFLTVYRAHMMVMTVHCILAVDFPIFPRILGKCEDFGTSLMDVGVGSFVFSLGVVSFRSFERSTTGLKTCITALRKALPILILGFIRLMMVKGAEYPEHLTEYGVHWNFFFTLGLVPALATVLLPFRKYLRWSTMGLLIALGYQIVLSTSGLQDFLLSLARPGILGANKEGIASLPGYLAIFLFGLGVGQHVLRCDAPTGGNESDDEEDAERLAQRQSRRKTELALELAGYAAASWAALGLCYLLGLAVSRRFANAPYVLWTIAYNTSYLAGYLAIELYLIPPGQPDLACPPLLDAINKNGLAVFLLSNLLTGLVNVSVKTMYMGTFMAMVILIAYSGGTAALAWALRGVRIKI